MRARLDRLLQLTRLPWACYCLLASCQQRDVSECRLLCRLARLCYYSKRYKDGLEHAERAAATQVDHAIPCSFRFFPLRRSCARFCASDLSARVVRARVRSSFFVLLFVGVP